MTIVQYNGFGDRSNPPRRPRMAGQQGLPARLSPSSAPETEQRFAGKAGPLPPDDISAQKSRDAEPNGILRSTAAWRSPSVVRCLRPPRLVHLYMRVGSAQDGGGMLTGTPHQVAEDVIGF